MGNSNASNVLCVVDCQVDFAEGGSLAVEGGIACSERIVSYLDRNADKYDLIVFTRDWHNPWPDLNGGHFSDSPDFVDSWPPHCQAGTEGAMYLFAIEQWLYHYKNVRQDYPIVEVKKGQGCPAYSGFEGRDDQDILLRELISRETPTDEVALDVCGIAFDYCVKATALSAIGWWMTSVRALTDLTVGVSRHTELLAAGQLLAKGVQLVESNKCLC